jgi:hypothetical protein
MPWSGVYGGRPEEGANLFGPMQHTILATHNRRSTTLSAVG